MTFGYLRVEAPGVLEAPPEGWHDTGDIVAIDAEGFVAIKGRLKRFAKVAGEMVSLSAVESFVQAAFPEHQHATVALPDARKGERIVLVTTQPGLTRAAVIEAGRAAHAAELMFPSEVIVVEHLPLLGSGKTDYVGIARLAAERAAQAGPATTTTAAAGAAE
jgi:acyl-[acyl-carrier-protein]-phospholipid O-acyltransferase/long-chain-fatty-acid--[acyl-carrier-protein] ligase